MHDEIVRYSLDGEIADSNIVESRERMVIFLEDSMREEGAVPSLDLEPQFTLDYQPDTETYQFRLSVYGVCVEGGDLWTIAGVTNGKTVMKYIPPSKSKQS